MSASWQKWCKGLPRKQQVIDMACMLGMSRREVASLCMEVWEWAEENATIEGQSDGIGVVRIASASRPQLDDLFAVPGLADAMSSVGWLAIRNGHMEFPKFGRHNGSQARRRALDAERNRANRVRKSSASQADGVKSPPLSSSPRKPDSKKFKPPSLEEVKAYCLEQGYSVDAEEFVDFYEGKGWMVGKNKMKDWRAAVRTWEHRGNAEKKKPRDPRGNRLAMDAFVSQGDQP